MNAIVNIGTLIPFAISLSDGIKAAQNEFASTYVEIGAAIGANGDPGTFGGHVPAVALWNAQGQPEYLQLTTVDNDAICITYVSVSGNGVNWNWMGDTGYTCGGDWYPSTAKFGSDNYQPRCTWIDADHSDDLHNIALSMHMPDFNGDTGLTGEFNDNKDLLCNSKARFMQWRELPANPGQDSVPPMFNPPLEYNIDGSDKDISAIFKPGKVSKRDVPTFSNSTANIDHSINRPGHVVISDFKAHTATEVCGSDTSRGPSFVSTHDGTYCDMSTKTSHPVCSDIVKTGCFDVDALQLVGQRGRHARDVAARGVQQQYNTHERWTPAQ
nr:hypothetical protein B0A51_14387 [Rachicladosporium sp. CCFEE 5018]